MHDEATEYRQGADRPLEGYSLVMAVFAVIVGLVGAAVAITGTRVRRLSVYELVLLTAATHKAARIVSKDAVTSPLRAPFTRFRGSGGPAEVMEEPRKQSSLRHALGELVSCPFCLDMWVVCGFTVGLLFVPRTTRVVTAMFTALAGADFLQLLYARLQQAAEH